MKKILILCANPRGTSRLRLDEEVREIEEGLKRSRLRDQFDIRSKWAIRFWDLRRVLLEFEPHIVHFTGHGEKNGLMFENEVGFATRISTKALSGLFELCADHVECVILNACFSEPQADAINRHIKYVIGMKKEILGRTSTEFAVGIYDALGAGKSYDDAFKFGCNAIHNICPDLEEHSIPVLKKNEIPPIGIAEATGSTESGLCRESPRKIRQVVTLAVVLGILLSLYFCLKFCNTHKEDLTEITPKSKDNITEEALLEDELMGLGQLIAYSLENMAAGYTAGGVRLNLLFLFNRGPDIYLEDFLNPLRHYIYKRIVKAVSKTIQNNPGLRRRISVLELDLNQLEKIRGEQWLHEIDHWQMDSVFVKDAIYEILLSVNRVTGILQIGGRLIIESRGQVAVGEKTFTQWNDIRAPQLIKSKYIPPSDKLIVGEMLEKLGKKTGQKVPIAIRVGSKEKSVSKDDLISVSSGDKMKIGYPLYFQFKMPGNTRFLVVLIKDGTGNLGNLVPGTANAITNGDYFISNDPRTHYTDILRDKVIVDDKSGQVSIGPYYPQKAGESTFFFFFLNKRNQLIEDMSRQADFPAGRDIAIKGSEGKPIRHAPSITHMEDLDYVFFRKIILIVKES